MKSQRRSRSISDLIKLLLTFKLIVIEDDEIRKQVDFCFSLTAVSGVGFDVTLEVLL